MAFIEVKQKQLLGSWESGINTYMILKVSNCNLHSVVMWPLKVDSFSIVVTYLIDSFLSNRKHIDKNKSIV